MAILWCGGEDIDFPVNIGGGSALAASTGGARSGWSRVGIGFGAGPNSWQSNPFPGGNVTSCWLTFRMSAVSNSGATVRGAIGLVNPGSNSGLYIGTNASPGTKLTLSKYDGTTWTSLAAESGTTQSGSAQHRFDVQLISYGSSATVNVYMDSTLSFTFTGDVTVSGVTSVGAVCIQQIVSYTPESSEFIVADFDTRSLSGLLTMALTGAGDTQAWTSPTYTNINGNTFSDANPTSSNSTGQDNMYNVTDLPTGLFSVLMVKESIRSAVSSSPTASQIKMGYKSGGTVAFGSGSTKTPAAAYTTLEHFDMINPVSGVNWAQTDMNALQLDFQSA